MADGSVSLAFSFNGLKISVPESAQSNSTELPASSGVSITTKFVGGSGRVSKESADATPEYASDTKTPI